MLSGYKLILFVHLKGDVHVLDIRFQAKKQLSIVNLEGEVQNDKLSSTCQNLEVEVCGFI